MHNLNLICIAAMLSCGSATRAFPQDKPAEKPAAATQGSAGPSSGARAEFLEEIAYYEQRYTRLAEAIPADKYAWRPGEGVRSIGEVYGHISAANYGVARALGTQPPSCRPGLQSHYGRRRGQSQGDASFEGIVRAFPAGDSRDQRCGHG